MASSTRVEDEYPLHSFPGFSRSKLRSQGRPTRRSLLSRAPVSSYAAPPGKRYPAFLRPWSYPLHPYSGSIRPWRVPYHRPRTHTHGQLRHTCREHTPMASSTRVEDEYPFHRRARVLAFQAALTGSTRAQEPPSPPRLTSRIDPLSRTPARNGDSSTGPSWQRACGRAAVPRSPRLLGALMPVLSAWAILGAPALRVPPGAISPPAANQARQAVPLYITITPLVKSAPSTREPVNP